MLVTWITILRTKVIILTHTRLSKFKILSFKLIFQFFLVFHILIKIRKKIALVLKSEKIALVLFNF